MKHGGIQKKVFDKVFTGRKRSVTLRMAPMIDMIFLLLLFFLVAAKWRPQEDFLPLQLPAAQAQERNIGTPEPLAIHISAIRNGCKVQLGRSYIVQINDKTVEANLAVLMEKMRNCLAAQKRFANDPVEIICEPAVKWEYVAKIYNMFFGAGLTDITFVMTEQLPDERPN